MKNNFFNFSRANIHSKPSPNSEVSSQILYGEKFKILYKKKFLPVLIQDSSDNFRKIRDHENNSGWVHISQLSKKKAAIVIEEKLILFGKSTIFSNPVALLKQGRLVKINKCKIEWCKVKTGKYKGWVSKNGLWGLL